MFGRAPSFRKRSANARSNPSSPIINMRRRVILRGISDFNFIFAQNHMPAALPCQPQIALPHYTVPNESNSMYNAVCLALQNGHVGLHVWQPPEKCNETGGLHRSAHLPRSSESRYFAAPDLCPAREDLHS